MSDYKEKYYNIKKLSEELYDTANNCQQYNKKLIAKIQELKAKNKELQQKNDQFLEKSQNEHKLPHSEEELETLKNRIRELEYMIEASERKIAKQTYEYEKNIDKKQFEIERVKTVLEDCKIQLLEEKEYSRKCAEQYMNKFVEFMQTQKK